MKKIKIFLVDDHAVFRAGLKMLLNNEDDMEVIGEAGSGKEAIEGSKACSPDIVLMDISLPDMNGMEVTKEIKKLMPVCKIIVLTMHSNEHYMKEFLKIGAMGYVIKKAADTELIDAIRLVNNGDVFIHPSLTKSLVKDYLYQAENKKLSRREEEILLLLTKGFTNKEIAGQINLSVKTVETYRARIMEKLNLHTRAELVEYAIQKGIVGV